MIIRERLKEKQNRKGQFVAPLMLYKKGPFSFSLSGTVRELEQVECKILEKLETLSSSRHAFPSSKKSEKNWGSYLTYRQTFPGVCVSKFQNRPNKERPSRHVHCRDSMM